MPDLVALRREKDEAWQEFYRLAMQQDADDPGMTPEQRVELDLAAKRAERRYAAASIAYDNALEEAIDG